MQNLNHRFLTSKPKLPAKKTCQGCCFEGCHYYREPQGKAWTNVIMKGCASSRDFLICVLAAFESGYPLVLSHAPLAPGVQPSTSLVPACNLTKLYDLDDHLFSLGKVMLVRCGQFIVFDKLIHRPPSNYGVDCNICDCYCCVHSPEFVEMERVLRPYYEPSIEAEEILPREVETTFSKLFVHVL